ncbi:MAG: DUF3857 domain-containing protein [Chitinophagaceae bacterium]|nr:DUF3857 domain-containing protein [Chitinophagaceae bacterium]
MKIILSAVFYFLLLQCVSAQTGLPFDVHLIPDSLRKGATSVYRIDETTVDVSSESEMKFSVHEVITIFNKRGLDYFEYVTISTDKFRKLEDVEVKLYDSLGRERAKFKRKDFSVIGSPFNSDLVSDDKTYALKLEPRELPCTIERTFTIKNKGYIDFPDWQAASFLGALQSSVYTITVPQKLGLRYQAYNTPIKPVITPGGDYITYVWTTGNVKEVDEEEGSFSWKAYMPMVAIAPNQFEFDDRKGSFATWKDYGQWNYDFYNEEKPFTETDINNIKASVAGFKTAPEKISFLYKKMQKEARYVSIQLGIGGLKPFPAKFVHEKKYGDCKALSNYMKQQLQVIGIKSYPAIIKSGSNSHPADPLFPNEGFDHIILCVPLEKDTMWLECTSQHTQPGVLGTFTENRNAVLITENGGVLVNTPKSKSTNNLWMARTNTELFDDGSSLVSSRIFLNGEFSEIIYALTINRSKDEIKKALVRYFNFKNPDEFEYKALGDSANGQNISITLAYSKFYDVKAGSKYFMAQKGYKLAADEIPVDEKRKTDFLFSFPYIKSDSVIFTLPKGFKPEPLPAIKSISNEFATYSNTLSFNEAAGTITVTTHLQLSRHMIPVAKYNEAATMFEQVKKDENQKIVLKKE